MIVHYEISNLSATKNFQRPYGVLPQHNHDYNICICGRISTIKHHIWCISQNKTFNSKLINSNHSNKMKRTHPDDTQNKNKRFSYSADGTKKMNQNMPTGHATSPYYSYQPSMSWVDPRMDPRGHGNMGMYNPQWNGGSPSPQPQNYSPIYNPMQPPPPPLPLERPPIDTPPPPPPHNQHNQHNPHMQQNPNGPPRRPPMNNNMRRRPPMNNLMPGPSGYVYLA